MRRLLPAILALAWLPHGGAAAADDASTCDRATGAEAIAACSRLIASDQAKGADLGKLYRNRCAAWNRDYEPDRALADCSEAIRLDARQVAARSARGDSWWLKGDLDKALADYNEAIKLDPKYAPAYSGRCATWNTKGDLERAFADCDAAIRLDPKYAPGYAGRCFTWNVKRDFDRATADCEQAIRLDPSYGRPHFIMGMVWRGKRDLDRAAAELTQAIRLDPKHHPAYMVRAVVWSDKRDYDRAIADYDEAIRLDPKAAAAYGYRCLALFNKKELDRALTDCNEAIKLNPKLAFAFRTRGLVWDGKRDLDRAIADYDEAIRLDPKYAFAYFHRGHAWAGKRDLDRAIADYDQAIRHDPKYAVAYFHRGQAWAGKRDFDRAMADYSEAIRVNPQYVEGYIQRGNVSREKRDYDRAIADYGEAIRLAPKNPFALYFRGLTWLDKREHDRAITDFDEAARLDPGYTAAFTNRGLAFERKGDRERARSDFEAALALPQKHSSGKWAHDTARERLAALAAGPSPSTAPQQSASSSTASPSSISRGPRLALLIGNSSYSDAPLSQAKKDVRALADELKRVGFEIEVAENLTKGGLQRAVDNFNKKIKPGSSALFFFSGYGVQSNRQTFILPTDAQIWSEADIRRDGASLETILADINAKGAVVTIAIIDASRRNPFERRFRATPAGLAPVHVAKNSLVIYSGRPRTGGQRDRQRAKPIHDRAAQGAAIAGYYRRGGFHPHAHRRVARLRRATGPLGGVFSGRELLFRAADRADGRPPSGPLIRRRGRPAGFFRSVNRNGQGLLFRSPRTRRPCRSPGAPACGNGSSICPGCRRGRQSDRSAAQRPSRCRANKASSRHRAGRATGNGGRGCAWRGETPCDCRT